MNPVLNFVRVARRDGLKEAWEKLKYNFAMLNTPEQRLRKEVIGFVGMLVGVVLAFVFFAWRKQYHILLLFAAIFYINVQQLKGKMNHLYSLKEIKKKFEQQGGDV